MRRSAARRTASARGRHTGVDANSGVINPDFKLLAKSFGIPYILIRTNKELKKGIAKALATEGPVIVELKVSRLQQRFRASSYKKDDGTIASRPIEDMDPLLPREELQRIMTMFD